MIDNPFFLHEMSAYGMIGETLLQEKRGENL